MPLSWRWGFVVLCISLQTLCLSSSNGFQTQKQVADEMSLSTLPCAASGYCSVGHVKAYMGDIYPSQGLKDSLEARSYKKEVVVIADTRLSPAYQTYNQFLRVGIAHILWLTGKPETCAHSAHLLPELGCAWSSQKIPDFLNKLYMDRVGIVARILRMGHNVLLVDTDVLVFDDPYKYLKSPPLKDVTIMAMRDGNGQINCGVVYVQNAAPDGAAAYMMADIVDRSLRWAENTTELAAKTPQQPAGCWEQSLYQDTLLSAVAGRPLFYICWEMPEALRDAWNAAHQKALRIDQHPGHASYTQLVHVPWPEELHVTNSSEAWATGVPPTAELRTARIVVPNTRGEWPAELGGRGFSPVRGALSSEFMARLLEDASPLWPDPEDPSVADKQTHPEKFGFLPHYFVGSWSSSGQLGWWNQGLIGPRRPHALAHFVHVIGDASNKLTVKMASGAFDYDLARRAHGRSGNASVFFSLHAHGKVPRAIAFSRAVVDAGWDTIEAFRDSVRQLALMAIMTNRTVAYPPVACNTSWVKKREPIVRGALPLRINDVDYMFYGGWDRLMCMWGGYMGWECRAAKGWPGGILPVEFDNHYMKELVNETGVRTLPLEKDSMPARAFAELVDSTEHDLVLVDRAGFALEDVPEEALALHAEVRKRNPPWGCYNIIERNRLL